MKKSIIIITLALVLLLSGCKNGSDINVENTTGTTVEKTTAVPEIKTNETSDEIVTTLENKLNKKQIVDLLFEKFGKEDEMTGNAYSFVINDVVKIENADYYHGLWNWHVQDEDGKVSHSSLVTEFFITTDGNEMYAGSYDSQSQTASFFNDNNMIK